jgi:hypothetical protein
MSVPDLASQQPGRSDAAQGFTLTTAHCTAPLARARFPPVLPDLPFAMPKPFFSLISPVSAPHARARGRFRALCRVRLLSVGVSPRGLLQGWVIVVMWSSTGSSHS